jgi:hypothetical protein
MRKAQKQDGSSKSSKSNFKYGIEVPKNWKDIIHIDKQTGNTKWQDSVTKEVGALIQHSCFEFLPKDFKPPTDYQYCRLHFVYEVKNMTLDKSHALYVMAAELKLEASQLVLLLSKEFLFVYLI